MDPENEHFKVGIFEDNPIVTQGLTTYFENNFSYSLKVIFSSDEPKEFLSSYKEHEPDFVIIDIISEKVVGLEIYESIFKLDPSAWVFAYSNVKSKRIIQTLISLGVLAYIPKTEPLSVFEEAFKSVIHNRAIYLPDELKDISRKMEVPIVLTKTEKKIIPFLIEGKSSKEQEDIIKQILNKVEVP